jgi:hypothetical protein
MADSKISALPSATALAGTEVVPVVQGGATKKATIDQILAPASGKGIDFAAAGGDTLSMYDEGTWTPVLSTDGTDFSAVTYSAFRGGRYIRVGNVVHIQCFFATDAVTIGSASGAVQIIGLPFAAATSSTGLNGRCAFNIGQCANFSTDHPSAAWINSGSQRIFLMYRATANGALTELQPANIGTGTTNNIIVLSGTYVCQ